MPKRGIVSAVVCLCCWAMAPALIPPRQRDGPNTGKYFASSALTRAETAALRPEFVLDHLRLVAHADVLGSARMQAVEVWTPAHDPGGRTEDRSRILYYKTVELELPATENGRPVSAHEAAKLRRDIQQSETDIDASWRGSASSGRLVQIDGQIVDIGTLLRRFDWRPVGVATYLNRPCVEFHFSPRQGAASGSRAERIMAAMAGDLWIDPESGQVLKVTFANRRAVRFGLGLLASFSNIQGSFEMQPFGDGWVWGETVVQLHGRELWFDKSGLLVKHYLLPGSSPR